jgi:hypothetical protein
VSATSRRRTASLNRQHERAIGLGARSLEGRSHDLEGRSHDLEGRSHDEEEPLRVYADPSGHPFCIVVATP